MIGVKRIFDFLKSRGARMSCPFCGCNLAAVTLPVGDEEPKF